MYLDEFFALIGITEPFEGEYLNYVLAAFVLDVLLVYLNLYVLIPFFLLKNKTSLYLIFTILSVLIISFGTNAVYSLDPCPDCTMKDLITEFISILIPTATLLGSVIGIKLFKLFLQHQSQINELEKVGLQTELAYLKDQINPHSLFNALNNIYVQSRKRPAEASESILLLSDLLRYQLYDCAKEKVYLKGEIEYLKNYLQLDALRKSQTEIQFDIKGDANGIMVAPFIFLPFLENAIKHGSSLQGQNSIQVQLEINKPHLHFQIKNPIPNQPKAKKTVGGIGLNNVKRRLQLMYSHKHQLVISEQEKTFIVKLKIDTSL